MQRSSVPSVTRALLLTLAASASLATMLILGATPPAQAMNPVVTSSFSAQGRLQPTQETTFVASIDNSANTDAITFEATANFTSFEQIGEPTSTCGFPASALDAGATCTISWPVRAISMGSAGGSVTLTSDGESTGWSHTNFVIWTPLPPDVRTTFSSSSIQAYESSTATFRFDHVVGVADVIDMDLVISLPADLAPITLTLASTCGGTTRLLGDRILVDDVTMAIGESCEVTFDVTTTTTGVYDLELRGSAQMRGYPNRPVLARIQNDSLTVTPPSTTVRALTQEASYSDVLPSGGRRLVSTLSNKRNQITAINITHRAEYDGGLTITPGSVTNTCGGTVTIITRPLSGSPSVLIEGAAIAARGTCELSFIVTTNATGIYNARFRVEESVVGLPRIAKLKFPFGEDILQIATGFIPRVLQANEVGEFVIRVIRPVDASRSIVHASFTPPSGLELGPTFSTTCGGTAAIEEDGLVQFRDGHLDSGDFCDVVFTVSSAAETVYSMTTLTITDHGLLTSRPATLRVGSTCESPDHVVEPGVAFVGSSNDEVILGTAGPDRIDGGGGNDIICGLGGDDVLLGGPGNDVIFGDEGRDTIFGGSGLDVLHGGLDIDRLFGGTDNDTIYGDGGSDRIRAGEGDDTVLAGSGADRVWGGPGDDELRGMGGQDRMWGEDGDDNLQGNWQSDRLFGGPGNDRIAGAQGKDKIYGEDGDDALFGGNNTDYLDGGPGTDTADGQKGKDNPLVPDISGCIAETQVSC